MKITWTELGAPSEPGKVIVKGVGAVHVKEDDISRVAKYDESVSFELIEATASGDDMRTYLLGVMVP